MARLGTVWRKIRGVYGQTPELRRRQAMAVSLAVALCALGLFLCDLAPASCKLGTDRLLAWCALLVVLVLWAQQAGNLPGISYLFGTQEVRDAMDKAHRDSLRAGRYVMGLKVTHWAAMMALVVVVGMLARGTWEDLTREDVLITRADIQRLTESSQGLQASMELTSQDIRSLLERIDKMLEQNAEILSQLEARNGTGHDATTDE